MFKTKQQKLRDIEQKIKERELELKELDLELKYQKKNVELEFREAELTIEKKDVGHIIELQNEIKMHRNTIEVYRGIIGSYEEKE